MKNLFLVFFLIFVAACAPSRKNPLSSSFHNMAAHYNAYFIAKERINEIEKSLFDAQDWNYNKILPIYAQFDSLQSVGLQDPIEDCIQKASIAIQRHPGSKWEDDSYILVGKARYYSMEFPDAIETYKYVNTHSEYEHARHEALAELIRAFTEFEEYNNAVAVSDYLEKEKLNTRNKKRFHLNAAYLHQKREDLNKMVFHLAKAEELYSKSRERARINFIIAQTYQSLGFESEAFRYYKNVLRNNPSYELEFYSKLYMARVTELSRDNDLKKLQKYFRNLIKDPKNDDYKDKIYYELAGFELKNGNLQGAIENYKLSANTGKGNQRQKGLAYLALGQIYYDSLKNFQLAKNYYDSTVATLPKDEENFEAIKNRQEILEEFVKQITIIHDNDSILALSELPKDSLKAFAVSIVEERQKLEEEKKKEQKIRERRQSSARQEEGQLINTLNENSAWYFSNTNALSKGRSDFIRTWGDRVLEDNWRRKNKSSTVREDATTISATPTEGVPQQEETVTDIDQEAEKLLAGIPTSIDQKSKLEKEIEEAYYQLGNIYNLRLEEDLNAAASFETLLQRFPDTEYEPEVLYQLFLIYKEIDPAKSQAKGNLLQQKFPETVYAKLVENPNYREESFAISEQLKKLYQDLYSQYETGQYDLVVYRADSALRVHPENEFSDNIKLLQILAIGKKEGNIRYQYEIGNFSKVYSESELLPYAKTLLVSSEEFQQKRYNSAKARFIESFNEKHFFVIVYDIKSSIENQLSDLVEGFLKDRNFTTLKTGNLILNTEKSMLLVNEFPGKGTATGFLQIFEQNVSFSDHFKGEKIDYFVITEDNFDVLYKTKDVSAYLNFYDKHY